MQTIKTAFFALVLLFSVSAQAQQITLYYCVGGSNCYPSSSGYSGPFEDYSVNGSRSPSLETAAYEAYRQGEVQKLKQYEAEVAQEIVNFRIQQEGGTATAERIEQIKIETRKVLEQNYPTPPPSVLSAETRRLVNPVPVDKTEEDLQKNLDPLWNQIKNSDPVGAAAELSNLSSKINPVPGLNISDLSEQEAKFLEAELRLSGVVNEQGFLRLPHSQTPTDPLYTSGATFEGQDIRNGMNQVLAAESLVGAVCAANPQAGCDAAKSSLRDHVSALYALDRVAAMHGLVSQQAYEMFQATKGMADFVAGVANGMAKGLIGTAEGLAMLVAHPWASVQGIASALYNFDQTFQLIDSALVKRYDMLVNGDPSERGELLGEAIFEIAGLFVGPAELAKIGTLSKSLIGAGLYEATAQVMSKSAKLAGVMTKAEVRTQLIGAKFGLKGEKLSEFMNWGTRHLEIGDQGELAISFARSVTPERYEFLRNAQAALPGASDAAKIYMTRQLTYESSIRATGEFGAGQLENIGAAYDRLDNAINGVVGKKAPADGYKATRAIEPEHVDVYNKKIVKHTAADAFTIHRYNEFASHRYTQPGQTGLYTSIGDDAATTAMKEVNSELPSELIFGTQTLHPENILDLTDSSVLQKLKIDPDQLIYDAEKVGSAYEVTQIIGDLAKKHGFDAILAPSAAHAGGINLILLP